jgi:hypothetical protein
MNKAVAHAALLGVVACGREHSEVDDLKRRMEDEQTRWENRSIDAAVAPAPPPPPPSLPKREHVFVWSADGTEVHDRDVPEMHGQAVTNDGSYLLVLEGCPQGATWQVGNLTGTCALARTSIAVADLMPMLGTVSVRKGSARVDPHAVLMLHLPDGDARVPIPPVEVSITSVLYAVSGYAFRFGNEPDRTGPMRSIWFGGEVFGRARTYRDVDAVAVPTDLTEVTGHLTCGPYSGGSVLVFDFVDTRVDVKDRRTGEVLHSKVFPPHKTCPEYVLQSDDDDGTHEIEDGTPTAAIGRWVKTLIGH